MKQKEIDSSNVDVHDKEKTKQVVLVRVRRTDDLLLCAGVKNTHTDTHTRNEKNEGVRKGKKIHWSGE